MQRGRAQPRQGSTPLSDPRRSTGRRGPQGGARNGSPPQGGGTGPAPPSPSGTLTGVGVRQGRTDGRRGRLRPRIPFVNEGTWSTHISLSCPLRFIYAPSCDWVRQGSRGNRTGLGPIETSPCFLGGRDRTRLYGTDPGSVRDPDSVPEVLTSPSLRDPGSDNLRSRGPGRRTL